jgi:hypothetical protein
MLYHIMFMVHSLSVPVLFAPPPGSRAGGVALYLYPNARNFCKFGLQEPVLHVTSLTVINTPPALCNFSCKPARVLIHRQLHTYPDKLALRKSGLPRRHFIYMPLRLRGRAFSLRREEQPKSPVARRTGGGILRLYVRGSGVSALPVHRSPDCC